MQFLSKSLFIIICILLTISTSRAAGVICKAGKDTLYVGKFKSQFTTVQSAIDAIPENNDQWIKIKISPGFYTEQVSIPANKPCVVLEGNSSRTTKITYNAHQRTDTSATFSSFAENIVAKGITFENSYNIAEGLNLRQKQVDFGAAKSWDSPALAQALAARIYGDKSAFFGCGFVGVQDTLWDVQGRHFFSRCYIEGAVDFIFGNGQSVYERCVVNYTGGLIFPGESVAGYITAQARESSNETTGFIFRRGIVTGSGQAYLGRAYRPYSRVLFFNTWFSPVVTSPGWDAWNFQGQESNLVYGEIGCEGPGSDTSKRVSWEKKFGPRDQQSANQQFSTSLFINQDGWLTNLPQ
ncbi:hypothetical protein Patl1_22429 [Pistacia atlantica]|uniref:Uncharacterized protein n=1 Tax=Pistacia atlantica TaxID=434234 RepID=A0ACC1A3L4_9ROSI|nr:hypothetical protein Patl1_22429 [Pistacia atlantica]